MSESTVLKVSNLRVVYRRRGHPDVTAVDGLSLQIEAGRTVGLVGPSGSGKSSIAKAILGLAPIDGGSVELFGKDIKTLDRAGWKAVRRRAQMIFQDVGGSLTPRMRIGEAVAEPLLIHGLAPDRADRARRAVALLEEVGLDAALAARYPHELSGGQRQRVLIARALATEPEFVIADEPTASLDLSIQTQILALLDTQKRRRNLAMLYISHDMRTVRALCDDVVGLST
ncbi:MAG: ABC transporter ATP-binding protein [Deltaproteobacteria bacterium]|nr:ABC transporter ATP-binding protein [Deltaproteobacteria bacterium]MCB9488807.1 ABC transporter ATP-binding protein [Deltaproteobacteria bacterium]